MILLPPNYRDMSPDDRDRVLQRIIKDLELDIEKFKSLTSGGISRQDIDDSIMASVLTDYLVDELGNLLVDENSILLVAE